MNKNDLKFIHPFNCLVAGMTSSGKTVLVRRFLNNWKNLISIKKNLPKVLWCFDQMQEIYNEKIENVEIKYFKGLPELNDVKMIKPDIIVIDDLMDEVDKNIKDLFTKISHHMNISIIFIVQNLFNQNRQMRTISLNSHYIFIMKGIRINQQVEILGRQIFPGKSKQILKIFKEATMRPFGYLLFDLHPQSKDEFRLRTRIFKEDLPEILATNHSYAPIYFELK